MQAWIRKTLEVFKQGGILKLVQRQLLAGKQFYRQRRGFVSARRGEILIE